VRDLLPANRDPRAALAYHAATKHSERSVRTSTHVLDWANQPILFKTPIDLERIPLPRFREGGVPALDAIAEPAPLRSEPPNLAALARVLQLAAGITKRRRHPGGEILLSAVLVFIMSSIVHMLLPYHKTEIAPAPNTDGIQNALRGAAPGSYAFPLAPDPKDRSATAAFHALTRNRSSAAP